MAAAAEVRSMPHQLCLLYMACTRSMNEAFVGDGRIGEKEDAYPNLRQHIKNMNDDQTTTFGEVCMFILLAIACLPFRCIAGAGPN